MPHKVHPLREEVTVISDASTPLAVRTEVVESGWMQLLTSYAAEDETTAFTSLRIAIEAGTFRYLVEEQISPAAAVLFDGDKPLLLTEGDRLVALFAGTTNLDRLRLYVLGWEIPPGVELTPELIGALSGGSSHRSRHLPVEVPEA